MSEFLDSFYITLTSDGCLNYFPDNRPNDFRSVLHKSITLDPNLHEIGLFSIDYNTTQLIFGHYPNDNVLIVSKQDNETENINLESTSSSTIASLIDDWNSKLLKLNLNINLSINNDKELEIDNATFKSLKIGSKMKNFLGTNGNYIKPGFSKYGNLSFDPSTITNFSLQVLSKPIEFTYYLEEPSSLTPNGIRDIINKHTYPNHGIYIDNSKAGGFEIKGDDSNYSLRLPFSLGKIMGIENVMYIGSFIKQMDFSWIESSEYVKVLCDVISPSSYNDSYEPILRFIRNDNRPGNQQKVFNPVCYVSICKKTISEIHIQLQTKENSPVPLETSKETVVTLHIKSKG